MTARAPLALYACLALLGVVLVATCVPGVFTLDECNYAVTVTGLKHGELTVPGTGGLPPSLELGFFDPGIRTRAAATSPIGSTAPPLYAFFALPFSLFGWRGLMALEVVAWLVTALLVFRIAARASARPSTRWIAMGTFLLGGYGVEYAQGVWPHALAACLCAAGYVLARRAREDDALVAAFAGGVVLGCATGVRYQNLVFAFAVGLGILIWAKRRAAASTAFTGGYLIPTLACSFINHIRLGSWNPISKGPGYLSNGPGRSLQDVLTEAPKVLLAKVVDFSFHPIPFEERDYWKPDPRSGAVVIFGAIKKAWLQSAPWIALALAGLVLAWLLRARGLEEERRTRELRALSLPIAFVLALFAWAGFIRHDGVCFNQRYFLELVPLAAVAFALMLERRELPAKPLLIGALAGGLVTLFLLRLDVATEIRQHVELDVPLRIGLLLLFVYWLASRIRIRWILPAVAGAAVLWAAVIHLGEDLPASRLCRAGKLKTRRDVEARMPPGPAALVVFGSWADVFGPTLVARDLVVANAAIDDGATLEPLAKGLLGHGRRVYALDYRMPPGEAAALAAAFDVRPLPNTRPVPLLELRPRQR
jgi:hypothetical protein